MGTVSCVKTVSPTEMTLSARNVKNARDVASARTVRLAEEMRHVMVHVVKSREGRNCSKIGTVIEKLLIVL